MSRPLRPQPINPLHFNKLQGILIFWPDGFQTLIVQTDTSADLN